MDQYSEIEQAGWANVPLMEELLQRYRKNPKSVHPSWQRLFGVESPREAGEVLQEESGEWRIDHLIRAYRIWGHLAVSINPIATGERAFPTELNLEALGFSKEEEEKMFPTLGFLTQERAPLNKIVQALQNTYCSRIGFEYMHAGRTELEIWLQERIEGERALVALSLEQKRMTLEHLNRSELFESFLSVKYVGQKRFSLEGGEALIPMLAEIVQQGDEVGIEECVIGMAHRGRLNVLCNILNKSYETLFSEFEEGYIPESFEGSGDVKYHKGFSSVVPTLQGGEMKVVLAPNPSHLESVAAVVQGEVKAKQVRRSDEEQKRVVPIAIHGDASIAGQGVVYETMQLCALVGYSVGGTIHIVINNQVGFTTSPEEGRSTRYCTDIAYAFGCPVFHVNGEDPEACVLAMKWAVAIRQRFHCDVFLDLNCYRKYGHNESDEPAFTQPLEAQEIYQKQPVRQLYRDLLIGQGVVEKEMAESLEKQFTKGLQEALEKVKNPVEKQAARSVQGFQPEEVETCVAEQCLREVTERSLSVPEGFALHKKLYRLLESRREMAEGKKPFDWGAAEMLAYGTLAWEGVPIRLSGQDSERGTFSHRHAVWVDQKEERHYCPLQHLKEGQGRVTIRNSPLSEYAVLGFEFGYSFACPEGLVIWEAQFGDFCNGAQVIIDQYISTAEQKWGQQFGLVLFLPHGYEGQGPEHSSARMERFLALAGEENMYLVNPSTPAQFFHLLRRQARLVSKKPLVVFTPKALLRHSECTSTREELTKGAFVEVLDDPNPPKKGEILLFCQGHAYYDLLDELKKQEKRAVRIVRIEQLYPFPESLIRQLIENLPDCTRCFWVQEEPENMGAWTFVAPKLRALLPKGIPLEYIGREASASPAVGSLTLHERQKKAILDQLRQL